MEARAPFSRASVVKNTALLLGWSVLIATVLRALIAQEVDPIGISLGAICALMLFAVNRHIGQGAPPETGAVAVLSIAIVIYFLLSWVSDGFRGSVIFLAPMVPLMASLMLGKRAARNTTVIMAGILLFILTQHLTGTLQPDEGFPEEIRYSMRAIIMLLSLVAINWITSYYSVMEQAATIPTVSEEERRDPLTGLLTREYIDQAMAREFARARRAENRFSFALVEVDDYQQLESEYGQQGAENCLLGVAEALRYSMRRTTDDLGRYGERQLCILMGSTGNGASRAGEKLRELIETLDIPLDDERTTRLTVSVGVCTTPARGLAGLDAVIEGAKNALASAQQAGGNSCERQVLGEQAAEESR